MSVIRTQSTSPQGNKYNCTRLGRIIGTSAFGISGIYLAKNAMNSDEFIKELTKDAKDAVKNNKHYYKGARKAAYIVTAGAITALCGFIAGGITDFCINRFARNKADQKQKA